MSTQRPSPLRRAFRGWAPRLALAALGCIVAAALCAPILAPADPNVLAVDIVADKSLPPSRSHLLGTDPASRDVASRLLYGARVSLSVGFAAMLVAVAIGSIWGAAAGFSGGLADATLMRGVDTLMATPRVLLLLVLRATLGPPSAAGIVLVLGCTGWGPMSRMVRAQVRDLRQREYVLAARALGVSEWRILTRHILPAVIPLILVEATLAFAAVIPLEAGLAFLDLGIQRPLASWGNIILDGYDQPTTLWWLILFPGLAIVATVLAANTIGDRLRSAVDPREAAR
jgi:peptide/nickel transport system permease protein